MNADRWIALGQLISPVLAVGLVRIFHVLRRVERGLRHIDRLNASDAEQWKLLARHHLEIGELERKIG